MFDKIAVRFVEMQVFHIIKNKRFFDTKVFQYQLISLTMT